MKILTVVGNRPQFIKAAAVSGPLRERHEELLVHTGQHYDDSLSRVFFAELGLARPDRELGDRRRLEHRADGAHARRAGAAARASSRRTRCSSTATPTRRSPARSRRRRRACRSCTSRRACARSTATHARGAQPRAHRPPRRRCCCAPPRPPPRTCARSRSPGACEVVGDVMVDVAMRRQPSARADERTLGRARRAPRRVPAADGAPRGQRRRPARACARSSS